jgi:hypothetical protein
VIDNIKYGECGKHPGNNMVGCIECSHDEYDRQIKLLSPATSVKKTITDREAGHNILKGLTDRELLILVSEFKSHDYPADSKIQILATLFFGDDGLGQIASLIQPIFDEVLSRMELYSPNLK